MDIDQLEMAGKIIGAIVALFGVVKILPQMKKIGKFFFNYFAAPLRIARIITELEPNGGSSLRDSVNRIENAQTVLAQKLAYSIDRSGAGFFTSSPEGNLLEASLGYCRIVGKAPEESLGRRWVFNIHPKDRARVIQEWKESIDNGATFDSQHSMINADGIEIPVSIHASPVKGANNTIIGFFGIIEPVE